MGDIPSKDEFANLARMQQGAASSSRALADQTGVPEFARRLRRLADSQERLALACTIAGNVVDRRVFQNVANRHLYLHPDLDGGTNIVSSDHDALIEALTKGGGDGG